MKTLIYIVAVIVNTVALNEAGLDLNDWQWWASLCCLAATYIACCLDK